MGHKFVCILAIAGTTLVSTPSMASTVGSWELSVGIGPSWPSTKNTSMQVTSSDDNTLSVDSLSSTENYTIGLGRHLFSNTLENRTFINDLILQFSVYYLQDTINGQAWDYGSPDSSNQNFKAPFNSTSFMLELKPSLFTYKKITPYFTTGIGLALNNMSYHETAISSDYSQGSISLGSDATQNLAYDVGFSTIYNVGIGARADVNEHLSVSMEYLYSDLGHFAPTTVPQSLQTVVTAPIFSVSSQTIFVRLNWLF